MAILENDIIIENTDAIVVNGDFSVQDANNQNIKHICYAQPGNYIGAASVGAMIWKFQNSEFNDFREVLSAIAQELKKDGYEYPDFINESNDPESLEMTVTAKRISIPKREVL
jgi:hypothetical protein